MSKRISKTVLITLSAAAAGVTVLLVWRQSHPSESPATIHFSTTTNNGHYVFHYSQAGSNWSQDGGPLPIPLPYEYKDTNSGITLRVENDGRHVEATSAEGKSLWRRDPFADAQLDLYRTRTPRIDYVGRPPQWMLKTMNGRGSGKFVEISYNSTQSGILDMKTGDFYFMGQD